MCSTLLKCKSSYKSPNGWVEWSISANGKLCLHKFSPPVRMLLERPSDGRDHNGAYRAPAIWFSIKGWSCNRVFYFSHGHIACAEKLA